MNPPRNFHAMKSRIFLVHASLALLILLRGISQVRAEIAVRLSVKFIRNTSGAYPSGGIGTNTGFEAEIDRGNPILAATVRGHKLQVVEYIGIQPPAPAGSNANYWFTLDARSNRSTIENAALADPATWRWNADALNIYVNDSASGQCSFIGNGLSISLGKTVGAGTVLHEVGHFFNLSHTHANDYADNTNPAVFTQDDLLDGDGLPETAPDNPNLTTSNQLCVALFNKVYTNASVAEQAVVDSTFENVMSYHNENRLLSGQMDIWGQGANGARLFVCSGRTWFLANDGSDGASGKSAAAPFATLPRGLSSVASADDIILLRAGNYTAPVDGTLSLPCTLSATRGSALITKP